MKSNYMNSHVIILLIIMLFMLFSGDVSAQHNLGVHIGNIHSQQGKLYLGLFDTDVHFPHAGKERTALTMELDGIQNTAYIVFSNLPPGKYALAVYQDINGDNKCNTNAIGYPKEPFGFSNNIRPVLSAPSFSKTAVHLDMDTQIRIKLIK